VGDRVLSFNFETGEAEYKEVTEVFVNETYELLAFTVGGEIIDTTAGHPFYVEGRGFVEAGELRVGDVLVSDDGELLPLDDIGIVRLDEPIKVYNLLVEGNHNYFVAYVGVLVHNADCTRSKAKGEDFGSRSEAFRQAKRDAGIPVSQNPASVNSRVKLYDEYGQTLKYPDGSVVYSREYSFVNQNGEGVVIQNHAFGHTIDGEYTPAHFNVRPIGNRETGYVKGTLDHYFFPW
jgi:hypothetical protein